MDVFGSIQQLIQLRYLQVCLGEVVRNNEVPTLINALDGKFIEPGGRDGRPTLEGTDWKDVEGDVPINDVI